MVRLLIFLFAVAAVLFTLFALEGCCPQVVQGIQTSVHDSTYHEVRVEYRDTIIELPGDTVRIEVPTYSPTLMAFIARLKLEKQVLQGERARLEMSVDSMGILHIEASCDSLEILLDSANKTIAVYDEYYRTTETEKTTVVNQKEKKGLPTWASGILWILGLILAIVLAFKLL